MADRTIEWGDPPSYATGDGGEDAPDGNFVVAQVPGGGTKLLEYDDSANAWQMRGDVNHNGNDITNVGSLSTDEIRSENKSRLEKTSDQTVTDAFSEITWDSTDRDESGIADLSNNGFTITDQSRARLTFGSVLSASKTVDVFFRKNGSNFDGQGRFQGLTNQAMVYQTSWFDVSTDDTLTVDMRFNSGSADVLNIQATWFECEVEQ